MVLSADKERLFGELSSVMDAISELLKASGENPLEYRGLKKVKNIARNCDLGGVKNITGYLNGDFRVVHDNRIYNDELERQMERAYLVADKL